MRYTRIADPVVEERLAQHLSEMACDLGSLAPGCRPLAVYLGGGYGRGDGGVAVKDDGSSGLYNDLDLFVFGKNFFHCRRIDRALQTLQNKWSKLLEVEVEFSAAKNIRRLSGFSSTLMFQELLQGHQQIFGEYDVLREVPRLLREELPLAEGARLFLNRGAGMLFAAQRILSLTAMSDEQRDFAVRNLHKAALGCGDALLLMLHQYRWKSDERLAELKMLQLPFAVELVEAYSEALVFKAQPQIDMQADLLERCERMRQLWCRCLVYALCGDTCPSMLKSKELRKLLISKTRQRGDSALRNALRWLLKTFHPLPLQQLTDPPLLRVLLELCGILFENAIGGNYINPDFFSHAKSYHDFIKHWEVFN